MTRLQIKRDEDRKRADDAHWLWDWLAHRDERKTVLAEPHAPMRLLCIVMPLTLKSAPLLLAFVGGTDWKTINTPTRLIVLHKIDDGITNLRTRHGLPPFDDSFLGEPDGVFCIVRQIRFPAQAAPPGAQPGLRTNGQKSPNKEIQMSNDLMTPPPGAGGFDDDGFSPSSSSSGRGHRIVDAAERESLRHILDQWKA